MADAKKNDGDIKIEYGSLERIPIDKKRTFTDIPSLITFSTFFIFYIGIAIHAFYVGDTTKLQFDAEPELVKRMEVINKVLDDVFILRYVFLCLLVFVLLLSVLYIVIIRCFPGFFVYTAIIIECGVLTIFLLSIPTFLFALEGRFQYSKLISAIVFISLTIVKLYVLRKVGTKVICEIIKESCRVILNFPSSILLSVLIFILGFFSVLYTLSIFSYLMTITSQYKKIDMSPKDGCYCPAELMYYDGSVCDENIFNTMCKPIDGIGSCMLSSCRAYTSTPTYIYFFHFVNIIVGLWIVSVIFNLGQMILSGTFATWYWTMNKKSVPFSTVAKNSAVIVKYHLGTLAYGTSPWVIVPMIQSMYLSARFNEFWKQPITMLVCWWNIFWKLADTSMIVCAIYGNGFYQSTKIACNLCMCNPLRFFIINKAIEWLAIFLTLFIALVTVPTIYGFIASQSHEQSWVYLTLSVIIISALLMVLPILILLSVGINTILLCIFEDLKNNNSSKDKIYYMNYKLKNLLGAE